MKQAIIEKRKNIIIFYAINLFVSLVFVFVFVNNVKKVVVLDTKNYIKQDINSMYSFKIELIESNKIKGYFYKTNEETLKAKAHLILIDENDIYYRMPTYITFDEKYNGWSGFVSIFNSNDFDLTSNNYKIALLVNIDDEEVIVNLKLETKELIYDQIY